MSSASIHNDQPLVEMNTTPLIDVLLVLLIMFIITIPLQTHAVKLDLPVGPPPEVRLDPVVNRLHIAADGTLAWNGTIVTPESLRPLLESAAQMEPDPELQLLPDALAPYARVDQVLGLTKQAGIERMGFVGNERYQRF